LEDSDIIKQIDIEEVLEVAHGEVGDAGFVADYAGVGDDDVDFAGDFLDFVGGGECFVDGVGLLGEFYEVNVAFVGERGEF
jgi:hypothetical protein